MVTTTSQAEILREYEQALKHFIIDAHNRDTLDWMEPKTVMALMRERAKVKRALALWKEKERVRIANED